MRTHRRRPNATPATSLHSSSIFSPLLSFPITHTLLLYTPEHFPLISFSLSPCHPKFPLRAFAQIPQPARGWHIVPSYWDATHKRIFCHGQIFTPIPTHIHKYLNLLFVCVLCPCFMFFFVFFVFSVVFIGHSSCLLHLWDSCSNLSVPSCFSLTLWAAIRLVAIAHTLDLAAVDGDFSLWGIRFHRVCSLSFFLCPQWHHTHTDTH